jgi:hypothetical protein
MRVRREVSGPFFSVVACADYHVEDVDRTVAVDVCIRVRGRSRDNHPVSRGYLHHIEDVYDRVAINIARNGY